MPEISYDAVIIGGGHNGLCTAAYLARAGLKVGVFERRHEEAGGVHTEEATVPGFWHNLHAQYMEFIDYMPFYHDFDLPSFGARMIKPEAQVGIAFADGRPPLIIYTPEHEEKTHASIAQFSKHDAEVFNEIRRKVMASDQYLAALLYTPPPDEARGETASPIAGKLFELWISLGFKPGEYQKSPKVLIDKLFESTELTASGSSSPSSGCAASTTCRSAAPTPWATPWPAPASTRALTSATTARSAVSSPPTDAPPA